MSILPWPPTLNRGRAKSTRKLVVDPLPEALLDKFAADIPGPKHETEAETIARIAARRAEILSYNPRNTAEAMLATHCVLMGVLAERAGRDAARCDPGEEKKILRAAKQLTEQSAKMQQLLTKFQSRPLPGINRALYEALGVDIPLIHDPDDPAQPDQATSAVIVPLHPAPKMLQ